MKNDDDMVSICFLPWWLACLLGFDKEWSLFCRRKDMSGMLFVAVSAWLAWIWAAVLIIRVLAEVLWP